MSDFPTTILLATDGSKEAGLALTMAQVWRVVVLGAPLLA